MRTTLTLQNRMKTRGYIPHIKNLDNAIHYHYNAWRWWYIGINNMIHLRGKKLTTYERISI